MAEQMDTTTSGGKLVFHAFGALAEFERNLNRERTQAGLAAARARGRTVGRPKALADPKRQALAQALYDGGPSTSLPSGAVPVLSVPIRLPRRRRRRSGRHRRRSC